MPGLFVAVSFEWRASKVLEGVDAFRKRSDGVAVAYRFMSSTGATIQNVVIS